MTTAVSADTLRELLPVDLRPISGWPSAKRSAFLEDWWTREYNAPRASRREVLREIEGMKYPEIVARYSKPMSAAGYTALVKASGLPQDYIDALVAEMDKAVSATKSREPKFTDDEYWSAMESLAQFMKGLTR